MKLLTLSLAGAVEILLASGVVCLAQGTTAPRATVEWGAYAHDAGGSKHSPAAQITRANVKTLIPVWSYRTGDFTLGDAMARDETTPLFVDNVNTAIVGELRYVDGCAGGGTKPGTFAVWKDRKHESVIAP
jgi:glucose dehydrogenase